MENIYNDVSTLNLFERIKKLNMTLYFENGMWVLHTPDKRFSADSPEKVVMIAEENEKFLSCQLAYNQFKAAVDLDEIIIDSLITSSKIFADKNYKKISDPAEWFVALAFHYAWTTSQAGEGGIKCLEKKN